MLALLKQQKTTKFPPGHNGTTATPAMQYSLWSWKDFRAAVW